MPAPDSISPDKLARLIGTPGGPRLIDVGDDAATMLVPGSIQRHAGSVADWSATVRGRAVVVIDRDGSATAHGVAAWLRSDGIDAETLEGGRSAWLAARQAMVDTMRLPVRDGQGRTVWVTRARPKVDRIACPWLIRRFVDPDARFLFVPAGEVQAVAARTGATPFDVEGVFWSHRDDRCTFDLMIDAFGFGAVPPLVHLATIVRGADTARMDIAPEAAGLLAISLGLSRVHTDDLVQVEAGLPIYDALYRWCRDARGETHDWTSHTPARSKVSA